MTSLEHTSPFKTSTHKTPIRRFAKEVDEILDKVATELGARWHAMSNICFNGLRAPVLLKNQSRRNLRNKQPMRCGVILKELRRHDSPFLAIEPIHASNVTQKTSPVREYHASNSMLRAHQHLTVSIAQGHYERAMHKMGKVKEEANHHPPVGPVNHDKMINRIDNMKELKEEREIDDCFIKILGSQ